MILVDTSSWIHFLRPKGDHAVRVRVERALSEGEACWCPVIKLELWNGAGGDHEKKVLRDIERVLPELSITIDVWSAAYELARLARTSGVTVPATDILIATCARYHGVIIESADSDFQALADLPVR